MEERRKERKRRGNGLGICWFLNEKEGTCFGSVIGFRFSGWKKVRFFCFSLGLGVVRCLRRFANLGFGNVRTVVQNIEGRIDRI